jgi:hypothetical protein
MWTVLAAAPQAPELRAFLPAIALLPDHSPKDAGPIFRGLALFFRAAGDGAPPEFLAAASQALARAFAMKRAAFARFALPAELVAELTGILRQLLAHPNLEAVAQAAVADTPGALRLQQALQS